MPCSRSRRPYPFRDIWLNSFILTNLSASILVTCSSHSFLLSTHSLIGWIPQDSLICCLLILSIFVFQLFSLVLLICFQHLSVFFYFSALVSSAYVIIGHMIVLYIFDFVSFLIYLFLQTRSFKQTATLAAF
jgi:Phosphoglycerol transferase and related proteins, alkaline phosphatase superfamily